MNRFVIWPFTCWPVPDGKDSSEMLYTELTRSDRFLIFNEGPFARFTNDFASVSLLTSCTSKLSMLQKSMLEIFSIAWVATIICIVNDIFQSRRSTTAENDRWRRHSWFELVWFCGLPSLVPGDARWSHSLKSSTNVYTALTPVENDCQHCGHFCL